MSTSTSTKALAAAAGLTAAAGVTAWLVTSSAGGATPSPVAVGAAQGGASAERPVSSATDRRVASTSTRMALPDGQASVTKRGSASVDLDADGYAETVAFDVDDSGTLDVLSFDTTLDGVLDTHAYDMDNDLVVEGVGVDSDQDGVLDSYGPLTAGGGGMSLTISMDTGVDYSLSPGANFAALYDHFLGSGGSFVPSPHPEPYGYDSFDVDSDGDGLRDPHDPQPETYNAGSRHAPDLDASSARVGTRHF